MPKSAYFRKRWEQRIKSRCHSFARKRHNELQGEQGKFEACLTPQVKVHFSKSEFYQTTLKRKKPRNVITKKHKLSYLLKYESLRDSLLWQLIVADTPQIPKLKAATQFEDDAPERCESMCLGAC